MKDQIEIESIIQEHLDELKPVPPRNQQMAARGRARFLAEGISANQPQRQKVWGFIFRKQQFAVNGLVALIVIITLFVGGRTTVRAAQDDLPNEPLYAIKILSEDISLQFQGSPEARVERLMQLSQTRIQEMTRLIETGQTPPERVRLRLEQHIQETLELSSNMDDVTLDRVLPKLHEQLQQQERDLERLQTQAGQNSQPVLEQTRTMLQSQLHVVSDGLLDHQGFRNTVRSGFHYGQVKTPTASVSPTPEQGQNGQAIPPPGNPGNGNGIGPNNHPNGSNAHMTPTPKNPGNQTEPGNSAGGNDKDKGKDPKDPNKNGTSTKETKDKKTDDKPPK